MHTSPSSLGDAFAGLREVALRDAAAARTRLSGLPGALLLLLIATLFGRLERMARTWTPDADVLDSAEECVALRRVALGLSADSSSVFADAAALGLIAGWMVRAFPGRGMRRVPPRPSSPRRASPLPVRAPPGRPTPFFRTPHGAASARPYCSVIVT